jgi:hypothetical protein
MRAADRTRALTLGEIADERAPRATEICTNAVEMHTADCVRAGRLRKRSQCFQGSGAGAGKGMFEHGHSYKLLFSNPQMGRAGRKAGRRSPLLASSACKSLRRPAAAGPGARSAGRCVTTRTLGRAVAGCAHARGSVRVRSAVVGQSQLPSRDDFASSRFVNTVVPSMSFSIAVRCLLCGSMSICPKN